MDVVFIENVFDPDPTGEFYEATAIDLVRENGVLRMQSDRCRLGLFSLDTWQRHCRLRFFQLVPTSIRLMKTNILSLSA